MTPSRIEVVKPQNVAPLAVGLVDAARLISVSDRHLWGLADRGEIPSVMIGNRRVFRVATLDAWLAAREGRAAS